MSAQQSESKYASGVNAALFKALAHPLRGRIMVVLTESEASPSDLADLLGETLGNVSYHVRELRKKGLIEMVREESRRGGTAHIYRASARPVIDAESWGKLSRLLREINSAWVAQLMISEMIEAIESGTFDARVGRTMLRVRPVVDEEGWSELEPIAERYLQDVLAVQARSGERMARTGEPGINVAVSALAFEMP